MPMKTDLSAAARASRNALPPLPPAPARPARQAPSTGPNRVLQSRRAPAQLSLFQQALPVR